MACSRTRALPMALFPPLVRTDGANYHGGDAQMYFDEHKAAPLRCDDKFINWSWVSWRFFFSGVPSHSMKACLQITDVKD